MLRFLRNFAVLAILGALVWGAFAVKLGRKTFAEHVDTISETRAAKALVDGTRSRVNPVLDDAKERVLGEYVEAPTHLAGTSLEPASQDVISARGVDLDVSARAHPSTGERVKLPGQR